MKNGWYVFKPSKDFEKKALANEYWRPLMCCGKQIVQVIEGEVWVTATEHRYDLRQVADVGKFKRRIKI